MSRLLYNNILETIGNTPLVRLNRIPKGVVAADVYAKIETINPGNWIKDRMAVKMIEDAEKAGQAETGRHDHRGHLRQHRHGAGHRGGGEGLQVHLHHHRQAVQGKSRCAAGVWRRGDRLPHRRRSRRPALLLFGVVAPRARNAEFLEGEPVRQPVQRAGALRTDRPGDLGADRRQGRSPRGRRRHRRHDLRRREIPEGAEAHRQGLGHRYLRLGVQEIQGDRRLRQERDLPVHHRRHRRGLPAAERRLQPDRSLREGDRPRRGDHDRPHRARGRHLRRQLGRLGDGRPAAARRSTSRRARPWW